MAETITVTENFKQGDFISASDVSFLTALKAAIDYRGDCTLELTNGNSIEGYLYNAKLSFHHGAATSTRSDDFVDLFPKNSPRAETIKVTEIQKLIFSGEDTASGKSWDDWQKKKAAGLVAGQN